jgi:hypothetical protein
MIWITIKNVIAGSFGLLAGSVHHRNFFCGVVIHVIPGREQCAYTGCEEVLPNQIQSDVALQPAVWAMVIREILDHDPLEFFNRAQPWRSAWDYEACNAAFFSHV